MKYTPYFILGLVIGVILMKYTEPKRYTTIYTEAIISGNDTILIMPDRSMDVSHAHGVSGRNDSINKIFYTKFLSNTQTQIKDNNGTIIINQ